jgi:Group II intron, maturase-specific domain
MHAISLWPTTRSESITALHGVSEGHFSAAPIPSPVTIMNIAKTGFANSSGFGDIILNYCGSSRFRFRGHRCGKVFTKPSSRNVKTFLNKIQETIDGSGSLTAGEMIRRLNQEIKGWTMYHRYGGGSGDTITNSGSWDAIPNSDPEGSEETIPNSGPVIENGVPGTPISSGSLWGG